jgi:hypothetical protein
MENADGVTEAMNRVCDQVGDQEDPFVTAAARAILERTEWDEPGNRTS